MNRENFHKKMLQILEEVPKGERLLLHSCCGPCSTRCLEALADAFRVTVLYYNPNITDGAEYAKRKSEQLRLLRETGQADFLDCDYLPQEFFDTVQGLEAEREGGARCYRCYALRIGKTARTAKENLTTASTFRPRKDKRS